MENPVITFQHFSGVIRCPVTDFVMAAYFELLEKGFTDDTMLPSWNDKVLACYSDGVLAGVMTYDAQEWSRSYFIRLGHVAPECRRRGIYTRMFDELVKTARRNGVVIIDGCVHVDNLAMRATAEKQGRAETAVVVRYRVESEAA